MKKNNRKLIAAIVLALALVLAAACALAAQSGDVIEGKMIWELSDSGVLTITGEGAIPDYDDTTKAPWDAYKTSITQVLFYGNITRIGNNAFAGCTNLANVEFADVTAEIGQRAFYGCSSLSAGTKANESWDVPTYVWADNNSTVTATRVSFLTGVEPETETATATETITEEPTCTEEGKANYIAEFTNPAFATQTKTDVVLPAWNHVWGEVEYTWAEDHASVTAKRECTRDNCDGKEEETALLDTHDTTPATCTVDGADTYTSKAFINGAFSIQTDVVVIPAGHDWNEPTYELSADGKKMTAKRVCGNDPSHVEEETADATVDYSGGYAPTCEEDGRGDFTSTFTNEAFGTKTLENQSVEPLGHKWGEATYTWAGDNSKVTAERTCTREGCGKSEIEEKTTESRISKDETCTEMGETTYTATFEGQDFETQTKTVADRVALGHKWGDVEYTWPEDCSTVTAKRICERDDTHVETETVATVADYSADGAAAPTCTTEGTGGVYTATFENAEAFPEKVITGVAVPALGHDWQVSYAWADDNSKVVATAKCSRECGEPDQTEEALVTSAVTQGPTCTEKGKTTYTTADFTNPLFTEQKKEVENIDALGHDPVHHPAKAATCTEAGNNEYDTCSRCDYTTYTEIAALGHELEHHDAKAATCTEEGWKEYDTCKRDGCTYTTYTKIAALGHDWGAPAYAWAKDKSAVAAKQVCTRDASHVLTETVETVYKVTKKPTYTATGVGIYTSKAFTKSAAFKVQTKKVTLDMLPRTSISKATVKAIDPQVYTGTAIKPTLSVKYNGKKLVKGTDYSVTFENNVKPGKATVTIKGKNAYKGKVTVTFKILPKKVKLVSLKAGKKKLTVTWKKGKAISGYEIEYSTKKDFSKSKTVTVSGATILTTKIPNLKPGKTYYVRIRTYKKVGSKKYYSEWSDKMKATMKSE